jgi:hypothetical protein
MIKTSNEITIIDNDVTLLIHNKKNGGLYTYHKEQNRISFNDANGNKIYNYPLTVSVNFQEFQLMEKGEIINFKDDKIMIYLSTKEVQEIAEKTFYEEGQNRIYDFSNHMFNQEFLAE